MSLNTDIHCLDNICISTEGKKPRKISKAVIEKIKEFMCEQEQVEEPVQKSEEQEGEQEK